LGISDIGVPLRNFHAIGPRWDFKKTGFNRCGGCTYVENTQASFPEALAAGMCGLKGHRSVGGCRASIYNAMPKEGVEFLADFMRRFTAANR